METVHPLEARLDFRLLYKPRAGSFGDKTFLTFSFTIAHGTTVRGNIILEKSGSQLLCNYFYPHGKNTELIAASQQQRPKLGSTALYLALITAFNENPAVDRFAYREPTDDAKLFLAKVQLTDALRISGVLYTYAITVLEEYLRKKQLLTDIL